MTKNCRFLKTMALSIDLASTAAGSPDYNCKRRSTSLHNVINVKMMSPIGFDLEQSVSNGIE